MPKLLTALVVRLFIKISFAYLDKLDCDLRSLPRQPSVIYPAGQGKGGNDKGKVRALSLPVGKYQRGQGQRQSQAIFYILSFSTKSAIKNLGKTCVHNTKVELVLATKLKPILFSS